jgi:two-component system, OmpR family, sensor histidine kinase ChvG
MAIKVLDRTVQASVNVAEAERLADVPAPSETLPPAAAPVGVLRRIWRFFVTQGFSSLTRRIVFLNVAGLLALVIGILYLSQFRAGLIDARVQSLLRDRRDRRHHDRSRSPAGAADRRNLRAGRADRARVPDQP